MGWNDSGRRELVLELLGKLRHPELARGASPRYAQQSASAVIETSHWRSRGRAAKPALATASKAFAASARRPSSA